LRVSLLIIIPECPLLYIRVAEFPVLLRVIDTLQKSLLLLFLREVEKELDYASSVDPEVLFKVVD